MPVKNAAEFLTECIDSILLQTYDQWELIAIDDHSTDDSHNRLVNYAQKDARIKTFTNDGEGIIPALQLAYTKCQGSYITRMDADDIMTEDKLARLLDPLLIKGNGYLSTGKVQYFSTDGLKEGYIKYQDWLNSLMASGLHYNYIYKECVIPSPCWMVSKTDFDLCGGFDHNIYPEDYDLCFRFYKNNLTVLSAQKQIHLWRDHGGRASRNSPHYLDHRFLELKIQYFLELDYKVEKDLVLWGAGKKGKAIADKLMEAAIPFQWITNNERKIGKTIYSILLADCNSFRFEQNHQIILSVATPKDQKEIHQLFDDLNFKPGFQYYDFT